MSIVFQFKIIDVQWSHGQRNLQAFVSVILCYVIGKTKVFSVHPAQLPQFF